VEEGGFELRVPRITMRPREAAGEDAEAPGPLVSIRSWGPLRLGRTSIALRTDSRRLTLRLAVEGSE
jgi:hypothetical protein